MITKPKSEDLIVFMKGKSYGLTEEQIKTGGTPFGARLSLEAVIIVPTPK